MTAAAGAGLLACAGSPVPWAPPAADAPSLRGLCAVDADLAWASGSAGTVLRTRDAGRSWQALPSPADSAGLDFRDVHAWSAERAILMAAGPGAASGLWRTESGGRAWSKILDCPWAEGFFDGIAFWSAQSGLLVGDPVAGALMILRTEDGGDSWAPALRAPPTRPGEFAFAASGTSVCVQPGGFAWIGTGGAGAARVWRSSDEGRTWEAADSPLFQGRESAGIFSVAFADARRGVIVGGDYLLPDARERTAAWTEDGGLTWTLSAAPPGGYRSGLTWLPAEDAWICTGPQGTDFSRDGGRTWQPLTAGFHAVQGGFAAGSAGRVASLPPLPIPEVSAGRNL